MIKNLTKILESGNARKEVLPEIFGLSAKEKAKSAGKKAQKDYVKQQGAEQGKQASIKSLVDNFMKTHKKSYDKLLADMNKVGIQPDDLLNAPEEVQKLLNFIKQVEDIEN